MLAAMTAIGFFITVLAIGRSLVAAGVADAVTALKLIDLLVLKLLRYVGIEIPPLVATERGLKFFS